MRTRRTCCTFLRKVVLTTIFVMFLMFFMVRWLDKYVHIGPVDPTTTNIVTVVVTETNYVDVVKEIFVTNYVEEVVNINVTNEVTVTMTNVIEVTETNYVDVVGNFQDMVTTNFVEDIVLLDHGIMTEHDMGNMEFEDIDYVNLADGNREIVYRNRGRVLTKDAKYFYWKREDLDGRKATKSFVYLQKKN